MDVDVSSSSGSMDRDEEASKMLTSPFIMLLPVPRLPRTRGCRRKMDATDPCVSFLIVLGTDEALRLLKKVTRKSFMLGLGCFERAVSYDIAIK